MVQSPVKPKNNQGQALIESLALSATLAGTLFALGLSVYFCLVPVGVNYLLHEFLVCKATQGESHCKSDFQQRVGAFLLAAKLTSFESTKSFNKQKVRITLRMPMNRDLTMQKELELYR